MTHQDPAPMTDAEWQAQCAKTERLIALEKTGKRDLVLLLSAEQYKRGMHVHYPLHPPTTWSKAELAAEIDDLRQRVAR